VKLIRYEQARQALADARQIDEVKDMGDKVAAMQLYARQSKDPDMEIWLAEIRVRAMRRLGELTSELKHAQPGPIPEDRSNVGAISKRAALASAGVSQQHASRCEKVAAVAEAEFEAALGAALERKEPVTAKEVIAKAFQRRNRADRVKAIVRDAAPLDSLQRFPLVYADPPWRYEHVKTESRAVENHYPTMSLEEIKALEVPAADDAMLFLWATSPKLAEAMEVLDAWGFVYRTCLVWVKDKIGMGYYARQKHELLLVGARGSIPTPEPANRPESVIHAPREAHSAKPDVFYDVLERMYPEYDGYRVELFQRRPREGWEGWGYECGASVTDLSARHCGADTKEDHA
jgi:N6-adenosine-specific RNA methylase IME4